MRENQKLEEFKNKGKKTLRQFMPKEYPSSCFSSAAVTPMLESKTTAAEEQRVLFKNLVHRKASNSSATHTFESNPLAESIPRNSSPNVQKFNREALLKLKESSSIKFK